MDGVILLALAGFVGGGMNALAGGGSFVTLPVLIASGVPSVSANATSSVALYPGGASSAWVYRAGLRPIGGVRLPPMLAVTLLGGLVGSLLLLWTPTRLFDALLPWLMLVATITLAFGARLGPALRRRLSVGRHAVLGVQFVLGVYGGYFGGAVGLMMMAAWSLLHDADIKLLNAPRTLMVTAANSIAILCFALAGAVRWDAALFVGGGALAGGYAGAHLGRILPAPAVRAATIALSIAVTTLLFVRFYR
ncbi:sulfite exporter TauE/SafE family protein [Sphingomonas crocodyli]|uniref:Probable membrane transporter protein n=1 Tax=Sphingomonas crocodyli TaxID=1979270 RepID=A0A437M5P5_9SPHN|nr:sulfite exporter TauE/SafE family protein [Sphingomonas crocodyli]RVT93060.1 sulfite exporter TauE/SafE family protein [Sphingomonas crocodyli]